MNTMLKLVLCIFKYLFYVLNLLFYLYELITLTNKITNNYTLL